ncbi:hypothetical protein [uncultured Jatrophihabitans sp.]
MSDPSDIDTRVAELDEQLRALESDGERSSDRFGELSTEREKLLNQRDDG